MTSDIKQELLNQRILNKDIICLWTQDAIINSTFKHTCVKKFEYQERYGVQYFIFKYKTAHWISIECNDGSCELCDDWTKTKETVVKDSYNVVNREIEGDADGISYYRSASELTEEEWAKLYQALDEFTTQQINRARVYTSPQECILHEMEYYGDNGYHHKGERDLVAALNDINLNDLI